MCEDVSIDGVKSHHMEAWRRKQSYFFSAGHNEASPVFCRDKLKSLLISMPVLLTPAIQCNSPCSVVVDGCAEADSVFPIPKASTNASVGQDESDYSTIGRCLCTIPPKSHIMTLETMSSCPCVKPVLGPIG